MLFKSRSYNTSEFRHGDEDNLNNNDEDIGFLGYQPLERLFLSSYIET
jgi:hypothetical protein